MLSNRLKKRKRLKNNHFNLNQGQKIVKWWKTGWHQTDGTIKKTIAGKSGLNPNSIESMSGSGYYLRLLKCLVEKVLKRWIAINSLNLQFAIKEVKQRWA